MNKMNKTKYMILGAYILIAVLFFTAGFTFGAYKERGKALSDFKQLAAAEPTASADAAAASASLGEKTEYSVILEDGMLSVYESVNGHKTAIAGHKISEDVFPKDDISALKSGMTFSDKNEAMAMFENFAS